MISETILYYIVEMNPFGNPIISVYASVSIIIAEGNRLR